MYLDINIIIFQPGGCRTGESCIVVNTLLSVNSDTGAVETIVIHACAR